MTDNLDGRIAEATKRVEEATDIAVQATQHEVLMSCLALALIARRDYPAAKFVHLEDSDQGDWQVAESVLDENLKPLEDEGDGWDDEGYAAHLYDNRGDTWQPFCVQTAGGRYGSGRWLLNIDAVLEQIVPHRTIELLHGRDPDSACNLDLWVGGTWARDGWTSEDIDPGRGYSQEDWDEYTNDVESMPYSPEFKAAVVNNRAGARDSQYID